MERLRSRSLSQGTLRSFRLLKYRPSRYLVSRRMLQQASVRNRESGGSPIEKRRMQAANQQQTPVSNPDPLSSIHLPDWSGQRLRPSIHSHFSVCDTLSYCNHHQCIRTTSHASARRNTCRKGSDIRKLEIKISNTNTDRENRHEREKIQSSIDGGRIIPRTKSIMRARDHPNSKRPTSV